VWLQALIGFVTAVEDRLYGDAMATLEGLELNPETEAMWSQLHDVALSAGELRVAERCSAALGDISRSRFLHKTNKVRVFIAASVWHLDDMIAAFMPAFACDSHVSLFGFSFRVTQRVAASLCPVAIRAALAHRLRRRRRTSSAARATTSGWFARVWLR
jgi:hypothetical protein